MKQQLPLTILFVLLLSYVTPSLIVNSQDVTGLDLSQILGQYTVFNVKDVELTDQIRVQIAETQGETKLSFIGCNVNWASLNFDANTRNFEVKSFRRTRKGCSNDKDLDIADAFNKSVNAIFRDGALVFKDASNQDTVILQKSN